MSDAVNPENQEYEFVGDDVVVPFAWAPL